MEPSCAGPSPEVTSDWLLPPYSSESQAQGRFGQCPSQPLSRVKAQGAVQAGICCTLAGTTKCMPLTVTACFPLLCLLLRMRKFKAVKFLSQTTTSESMQVWLSLSSLPLLPFHPSPFPSAPATFHSCWQERAGGWGMGQVKSQLYLTCSLCILS